MEKKKIDRRKFLKTFGVGAAAATAGLYGCKTERYGAEPLPLRVRSRPIG